MKQNILTGITIIFFVAVNTSFFWEGKLGFYAFPVFGIMILIYLILMVILIGQLRICIKEKFKNRKRKFFVILLTVVLTVSFFFPAGVIDFDSLSGKDLLVAYREGTASCGTTIKLKENNKFVERIVCFGVSETKGTFVLKNDTVFFTVTEHSDRDGDFFKFAILKKTDKHDSNGKPVTIFTGYKNENDSTGLSLMVFKNKLQTTSIN